jgi:hypothetical protein
MAEVVSIPPQMQPVEPPRALSSKAALRYTAVFSLVEIISLSLTLWATTQPWFLFHDAYPELSTMGYSQRAQAAACDVLIYGDSTALAGLDPAIIEAKTGLKTCNIAEWRPVEDFVGVNFPLDQYLARNPAPKYLVTSWTPSNFQLEHPLMRTNRAEGFIYALQYDRGSWLWRDLVRHPEETLSFLTWVQSRLIQDALNRVAHLHDSDSEIDPRSQRDHQAGMWAFQLPAQKTCVKVDDSSLSDHSQNAAGVAEFRKRYEVNGTKVIVNVSPIADCSPDIDLDKKLTAGLSDNALELFPIRYFNDLNFHLDKAGSELYSVEISAQIVHLIQTDRNSTAQLPQAVEASKQ